MHFLISRKKVKWQSGLPHQPGRRIARHPLMKALTNNRLVILIDGHNTARFVSSAAPATVAVGVLLSNLFRYQESPREDRVFVSLVFGGSFISSWPIIRQGYQSAS